MNLRGMLLGSLIGLTSCATNDYNNHNSSYNHNQENNVVDKKQDELQTLVNKADSYYEDNNWKEASAWYKKAIDFKEDDNDALFHYKRGFALAMSGEFDEALKEYKEGYKEMPHVKLDLFKNKEAGRLYRKGMEIEEKDKEEARKLFKRSMELDPRSPLPYNELGNMYLREGNNEDALEMFNLGGKCDPFSGGSLVSIASALKEQKKYKEAKEFYKLSLVITEQNSMRQLAKNRLTEINKILEQEK